MAVQNEYKLYQYAVTITIILYFDPGRAVLHTEFIASLNNYQGHSALYTN